MNNALEAFVFIAAFLETIVFAWLFIFVIVVMPGIGELDDGGFLRAFQVIDGVIQKNQPVFVFIWMGSVLSMIVCTGLGLGYLDDDWIVDKVLLTVSTVLYLVTQVTTFTINVPMNNRVQSLNMSILDSSTKEIERKRFEGTWNFWNNFRTAIMGLISVYLLTLLLRI